MPFNRMTYLWVGAIIFAGLFYVLSPILTPFFIASLLAYLGDPVVERLARLKMPRLVAALLVFFVLFSIFILMLLLLVPLLEHQIFSLIAQLPELFNWVQTVAIPWLNQNFGIQDYLNLQSLQNLLAKNWQQAGNFATTLIKVVSRSGYSFFLLLLNFILVPVVTFYLLRDWDKVMLGIQRLLPRQQEPTILKLARDCNDVIGAFFRGQLLVMLSLAIYYSIALSFLKLNYALLIGIMIGLIAIVPYLGFSLGIIIAVGTAFIQFHQWSHVVSVLIVFAIGHVLENYILSPMLVGDRIGLHPVAVIFAILAGGQIYGFIGVLLALPVAAVIVVLLRFVKDRYIASSIYNG